METLINNIGDFFLHLGYIGIFIMMALEASFFPFPSEVAMIPAGFLVSQGKLDLTVALLAGTFGSILGGSVNYMIAKRYGKNFIITYGKYLFIDDKKLVEIEKLFRDRGKSIVFFGRFIPVVRQYISFPPGMSGMPYIPFAVFTGLGSFIWVSFLAYVGYFYGGNYQSVNHILLKFKYIIIGCLVLFTVYKVAVFLRKNK